MRKSLPIRQVQSGQLAPLILAVLGCLHRQVSPLWGENIGGQSPAHPGLHLWAVEYDSVEVGRPADAEPQHVQRPRIEQGSNTDGRESHAKAPKHSKGQSVRSVDGLTHFPNA